VTGAGVLSEREVNKVRGLGDGFETHSTRHETPRREEGADGVVVRCAVPLMWPHGSTSVNSCVMANRWSPWSRRITLTGVLASNARSWLPSLAVEAWGLHSSRHGCCRRPPLARMGW
jgi:hypothetical protein